MKAIVHHRYGSSEAIQYADVEKPVVGDNQVLVKVLASSLNAADWHMLSADIFLVRLMNGGLLKPKDPRLGIDVAGRVEAVGAQVTQFRPGAEVFGAADGALAEYALARETGLALKPAALSFEATASLPVAALTALQGLRDYGKLQPGQNVLIYGASGGVGMFAVQIAKALGAEVTAVCSTRNMDIARASGAARVFDYTREDFTRAGQRYDVILAVNGYRSLFTFQRALTPTGIFVMAGASSAQLIPAMLQSMLLGPRLSKAGGQTLGFMGMAKINQKDLAFVAELVEAGKVKPVIDQCYPLSQTAEAFRYFEKTHPRGKVVITV